MKKLTNGEAKLVLANGLDTFGPPESQEKTESRDNPYSGDRVMMNRFAARLYDLTMQAYGRCQTGERGAVRTFDRLKYLLLKIDENAYMKLVD
jgi:hypothetical protein